MTKWVLSRIHELLKNDILSNNENELCSDCRCKLINSNKVIIGFAYCYIKLHCEMGHENKFYYSGDEEKWKKWDFN